MTLITKLSSNRDLIRFTSLDYTLHYSALSGHILGYRVSLICGRGTRPSGSSIARFLALVMPCLGLFPF